MGRPPAASILEPPARSAARRSEFYSDPADAVWKCLAE